MESASKLIMGQNFEEEKNVRPIVLAIKLIWSHGKIRGGAGGGGATVLFV